MACRFALATLLAAMAPLACASGTSDAVPFELNPTPDSGADLLPGPDAGVPYPAADGAPGAPDSVQVAKGCAARPISLGRFPVGSRTTASGRIFGGWGGSASALPAARPPLVLVHGNGETADRWLSLRKELCSRGYSDQEIWAITFKDKSCFGACLGGSNTQHATELERFVKLVLTWTGASRVRMVAVSMGVTTARYYMKFRGGLQRNEVAMAYLVSGPNHGTPGCDIPGAAAVNVACAEISTATLLNGWLRDLNHPDETPRGQHDGFPAGQTVAYRTVSYTLDPAFPGLYFKSPRLKGADHLQLPGAQHALVPFADLWGQLGKVK